MTNVKGGSFGSQTKQRIYVFVGGISEPQSIRKPDRWAVKEQITGIQIYLGYRDLGVQEQTVISGY